jgi:hypothetical protein
MSAAQLSIDSYETDDVTTAAAEFVGAGTLESEIDNACKQLLTSDCYVGGGFVIRSDSALSHIDIDGAQAMLIISSKRDEKLTRLSCAQSGIDGAVFAICPTSITSDEDYLWDTQAQTEGEKLNKSVVAIPLTSESLSKQTYNLLTESESGDMGSSSITSTSNATTQSITGVNWSYGGASGDWASSSPYVRLGFQLNTPTTGIFEQSTPLTLQLRTSGSVFKLAAYGTTTASGEWVYRHNSQGYCESYSDKCLKLKVNMNNSSDIEPGVFYTINGTSATFRFSIDGQAQAYPVGRYSGEVRFYIYEKA